MLKYHLIFVKVRAMTATPETPILDLAERFKRMVQGNRNVLEKLGSINRVAVIKKQPILGKPSFGVLIPSTPPLNFNTAIRLTPLIIDQSGSMGGIQLLDQHALRRTNIILSIMLDARQMFDEALMEMLAEKGIPKEKIFGAGTNSVLSAAIDQKNVYYLSCLLALGIDPNQKSLDGIPLLYDAIRRGHPAHVKELLQYGAEGAVGEKTFDILMYVTRLGLPDVLEVIFDPDKTVTPENAFTLRHMFSSEVFAEKVASAADATERAQAEKSLLCCQFIEERVIAAQLADINRRLEAVNKTPGSVRLPRMRR